MRSSIDSDIKIFDDDSAVKEMPKGKNLMTIEDKELEQIMRSRLATLKQRRATLLDIRRRESTVKKFQGSPSYQKIEEEEIEEE